MLRMLAACVALVVLAYADVLARGTRAAWAPWLLAIGSNGIILSLMALGAMRRDRLPRSLGWIFMGLFVLCAGAFVLALALPPDEGAGGALLFGLPVRTAVVLYGIGVVPIAVLPLAFALTFDTAALSDADLARVRDAAAQVRAAAERPA